MIELVRKKSPRAPSIPLSEAIDGALKIYAQDRRHSIPMDLAAQHLGYKNANNGTAVKALASIRYFGLLDRPQEGLLAVNKELEDYQFAPADDQKNRLVRKWLLTPPVFSELLGKFKQGLPSDQAVRFELIQLGFLPDAAQSMVEVLKSSVEFARYYERSAGSEPNSSVADRPLPTTELAGLDLPQGESAAGSVSGVHDRIPVRLTGGRRAFLEIPSPFFVADKQRLKSQIDLLLAEDE
jgi:hypothetical protein